jgi:hypothetical protein
MLHAYLGLIKCSLSSLKVWSKLKDSLDLYSKKKNIPCFRKEIIIIIIIITLIFAHDNSHLINDRIFLNEWPKPIFVIHTGLMPF